MATRLTLPVELVQLGLDLIEASLAGKEIKLRDAGVRIIFRVTDTVVEVLRVG